MEEHQILQQNFNINIRGLWKQEWVRPYESIWSLINTYKTVNLLKSNLDAMNSLGLNIQFSTNDFYLPYGIFCNVSSYKNDINDIIGQLSPAWHKKQLRDMFDKDDISPFISKQLKFCPKCMENGYHSVFHQLKGVRKCPFHPEVTLVTYIKQMYLIGKQSEFEYNKTNISNVKCFFGTNIFDKETNFEDGTELKLPVDWSEISEIEEYAKQWDGIRKEYDKIRAIGTDINNTLIMPRIGTFLLKNNRQTPFITIYNIDESDILITKEIKKKLIELGLNKLVSKNIKSFNFRLYYTYVIMAEMLQSLTYDTIEYKIYQIKRGKDISYSDEIGLKLLFLIYIVGDYERVEDIFMDIIDGIKYYSNTEYNTVNYQPKIICIRDLNIGNLPISAQYHILKEFIKMSWNQLKEYAMEYNYISKSTIQNENIFNKDHLIYLENDGIINIYKY